MMPPLNGASATVKFLNPTVSPPIIPKIIINPTIKKIIIVATLISANQYSDSPNPLTDK